MGIGDMLFYSFVVYPVINWLSSPQRKYSYTRRIIYSMSFLLILVGYQISQSSLVQKNLYGVMNVTQEDFRPKWVIPTTTTANATTNTPVGKIDEVTKDDIKLSQTLSSPPPVDAALRKSYKRMLLKYHPDKQPQGTSPEVLAENEVQFHAIKNAYDVLINNHKRAVYNVFGEAAVSTLFTQSSTSSSKSSNSDSSHKNKANGKKSKRGKGGSKGGGLNGSGVNRKEHGQFKRMMLLQLFAYYGSTFIYTFFTTINDTNSSVSSQGCYFGLLCMFCFELFCYFYCDPLMMVVVPYKRIVGDSSVGDAIIHVSGASMSEPVLLVKYCFRYLTNILAPTLTLHEVCEGLKLLYPVYMNGFCRCLLIQLTAYEPSQTLSPLSPNKNSIKSATAGDQKQSQQQRKQPEPQPQPQPQPQPSTPQSQVLTTPPLGLTDGATVDWLYSHCALVLLNNNVLLEQQIRGLCNQYSSMVTAAGSGTLGKKMSGTVKKESHSSDTGSGSGSDSITGATAACTAAATALPVVYPVESLHWTIYLIIFLALRWLIYGYIM